MMEDNRSLLNILSSAMYGYMGMRTDRLRKKLVSGLSVGFSRVLSALVMLMLLLIVLAVLAFAFVMLVGEAIGSLWGAAFIVGGVYLAALLVVFLLRKRLFLNMFTSLFGGVFNENVGDGNLKSTTLTIVRHLRKSLDI